MPVLRGYRTPSAWGVGARRDRRPVLEFNYAYNPYCAYNERWSCPLTPFENRLRVPIRAGEKSFK